MKFINNLISLLLLIPFVFTSCDKDSPVIKKTTTDEIFFANQFAYHALDMYYRWSKEIHSDMQRLDPETNQDPIKTVDEIRYKENGHLVDRWTFLTDDFASLMEGSAGISTTYGFYTNFYRNKEEDTEIVAVIGYVSKNSPAEKAGLHRGDIICEVNHKKITDDNFRYIFDTSSATFTFAKIEDNVIVPTDREVELTAVKMYEDPIIAHNIFNVNGKPVAYLAYTGFDLTSIPRLIEICKEFKAQKVTELILDLRYNGGGYVVTEEILASMLAPQQAVKEKALYETEEYNENITSQFHQKGIDTKSYFSSTFKVDKKTYNTSDANIGLKKIYALVGTSTASASESILIGLMPYLDITIIGERTHGKYCTGITLEGTDIFNKMPPAIDNWGIYVMISVYKNSLGQNPCIPNGLQPDYARRDNPFDPLPLGNMEEPLTQVAIKLAAGEEVPQMRTKEVIPFEMKIETPSQGLRIADHHKLTPLLP